MMYVLGLLAGTWFSVQAAVNSRLREHLNTPFLSAMISCSMSFSILVIILLARTVTGSSAPFNLAGASWWMFTGGPLGAFVLVGLILLFPVLGAIQTSVLPIFGMILLGILTDTFGWFGYDKKALTAAAAAGVILLIIGVVCNVILPGPGTKVNQTARRGTGGGRIIWQAIGVLMGMCSATQSAVNGRLGVVTGSPLVTSVISIFFTCAIIILINVVQGNLGGVKKLVKDPPPWWSLTGGIYGAVFVLSNAVTAPVIGAGMLMILTVSGQLLTSSLIQQFGLLGSNVKKIGPVQIFGLLLILIGVILVRM